METGGAQLNLLSQAGWFHQRGYPVTVAFLYDKEGLHEQWQSQFPFPIIDLKSRRWSAGKMENLLKLVIGYVNAFKLIANGHYQAIETFTHHGNLIGIPLAWLAGIPKRVASHRGRFKSLSSWQVHLHTWIVNSSMTSCLVTNSQRTFAQALEEGIHPQKMLVITNGIRLPDIKPETHQQVRDELGIKDNEHIVLSVGRLRFEKGHTFLLKAAALVLQALPDTHFVLAGDGTLRAELEEETMRLKINARVRFLGTRYDAIRLMSAADVFALPSRTEGMPNALLEAMGSGIAVVAFRVGGVEEIIQDEQNGLLVDPEDVPSLATAIIRLLKNDDERKRIAFAGKQCIIQEYSLERMCRRFEVLLDSGFQEKQS